MLQFIYLSENSAVLKQYIPDVTPSFNKKMISSLKLIMHCGLQFGLSGRLLSAMFADILYLLSGNLFQAKNGNSLTLVDRWIDVFYNDGYFNNDASLSFPLFLLRVRLVCTELDLNFVKTPLFSHQNLYDDEDQVPILNHKGVYSSASVLASHQCLVQQVYSVAINLGVSSDLAYIFTWHVGNMIAGVTAHHDLPLMLQRISHCYFRADAYPEWYIARIKIVVPVLIDAVAFLMNSRRYCRSIPSNLRNLSGYSSQTFCYSNALVEKAFALQPPPPKKHQIPHMLF